MNRELEIIDTKGLIRFVDEHSLILVPSLIINKDVELWNNGPSILFNVELVNVIEP
jgi:hypothetical protein